MEKKIVLVTGGSGLVGNGIKSISNDYDKLFFNFISSKEFDLLDLQQTKNMFESLKPNYVIHLAACVGGLYKNMNNKVEMLEKNLIINYNVVKCSHDYKVEKLICCLSTCIFPDKVTYPIDESMLHDGPPHNSNDTYAYSKRMLEIHCRAYRENYGDNFICVTPTNIYGPHDNFDLKNGHVIPSLIHKCYIAKKQNIDFVIKGSGNALRQFIYSNDLGKLIIEILLSNNNESNIILSVSEDEEISIKDIAIMIAKSFDYENRIVFDTNYSDGQYKKTVSNKKILEKIPDFKFIKMNDGINKTVSWFVNNK